MRKEPHAVNLLESLSGHVALTLRQWSWMECRVQRRLLAQLFSLAQLGSAIRNFCCVACSSLGPVIFDEDLGNGLFRMSMRSWDIKISMVVVSVYKVPAPNRAADIPFSSSFRGRSRGMGSLQAPVVPRTAEDPFA